MKTNLRFGQSISLKGNALYDIMNIRRVYTENRAKLQRNVHKKLSI